MIRYFFPLLMIAISGGLYYLFIDPLYIDVKVHGAQIAQLNDALANADKIIQKRNELQGIIRSISEEDRARLQKMLPTNVDNVRLILEVDQLATKYKMVLKNADVLPDSQSNGALGPNMQAYSTITLKINIEGSYESFRSFIEDLDRALRIIDVSDLAITVDDKGLYKFELKVKAYWLK